MGIFGKSKKDQANDLMNEGVTVFNKFDYNLASYKFSEVLSLDPKNRTALLYKDTTTVSIVGIKLRQSIFSRKFGL